MISEITLKSGPTSGAPGLSIPVAPITVFVGPNNSGKSRVLFEIEQRCASGSPQLDTVILDNLGFKPTPAANVDAALSRLQQQPNQGEILHPDHIVIGSRKGRSHVHLPTIRGLLENPVSNLQYYCPNYVIHTVLKLDGPGRISLVNQQPAGDLQGPQHQTFGVLFTDDKKRADVRRIIHDAFNSFFVIDPTNLGQLRIRLSDRAPIDATEERGIDAKSIEFHKQAQLIGQASDGVKAFTGIITELIAGDPDILLIDEPEAFLHPSLASKLGLEVASAASKTEKRVFASTHSPAFLMGCIQSGAAINIVRLTYRGGIATARILPSADILPLMRNPLLRSTNVLQGLFYEFVIVTEADTDRAFYQEMNERLLRYQTEWGTPNCLFIHAQNKQTIPTILKPLRQLGIPAAGIIDIDVLKEGGTQWSNLVNSAGLPELERNGIATLRASVKDAMDKTGKDMKRDGGTAILDGSDKEAADNLLAKLAEYGLFVVPSGELEFWLKPLGVQGHGPNWLIQLFEKMGEDPESTAYIKPGRSDVWKFMSTIREWLVNPRRKGIPSS